ncbi:unnamed protein product [Amoebophrya sp. A25]|nr:unnamed protein product [Amoebophrya sp. A25]|eukprot:GSA25T00015351001.1
MAGDKSKKESKLTKGARSRASRARSFAGSLARSMKDKLTSKTEPDEANDDEANEAKADEREKEKREAEAKARAYEEEQEAAAEAEAEGESDSAASEQKPTAGHAHSHLLQANQAAAKADPVQAEMAKLVRDAGERMAAKEDGKTQQGDGTDVVINNVRSVTLNPPGQPER